MFECVINISEGRDREILEALDASAGYSLKDRHSDADHHRSVFTLVNVAGALRDDVRSLISLAVETLDLEHHVGVHPRLGVVDVVPFVALADDQFDISVSLRNECAQWMGEELNVPVFLYGPLSDGRFRTLPEIRNLGFKEFGPDFGPSVASVRTGATAFGARSVLVAWNIWLEGVSLIDARRMPAWFDLHRCAPLVWLWRIKFR